MAAEQLIGLAVACLALLALPSNAATDAGSGFSSTASSAVDHIQKRLNTRAREHKQALAAISANMSITSAMQTLRASGSATADQMAFLNSVMSSGASASKLTRHLRAGKTASSSAALAQDDSPQKAPGYASGVGKAKVMLNSMLEEVMDNYETEQQECCDFENTQTGLLEELRHGISSAMVESAEARREILDAEGRIEVCEVNIPKKKDELSNHQALCKKDLTQLRLQLAIVKNDSHVMGRILDMIECDVDQKSALMFLHCKDHCSGQPVVSPHHTELQRALAQLQSNETKQLLSAGFADAFERADAAWPPVPEVQEGALCQGDAMTATTEIKMGSVMTCEKACAEDSKCSNYCHGTGMEQHCFMYESCLEPQFSDATAKYTCYAKPVLPALETRAHSGQGPCKFDPTDKTSECSIKSNPNCGKLQDNFMKIRADVDEKEGELTRQINELERSCKKTQALLSAEIEDYEKRLSDAQIDLAAGTKKQNEAESTSSLKNKEFNDETKRYWDRTETCHANYAKFESEECGLKKIRGELYKMQASSSPAFFQDCEVSEWVADGQGCSRSCDGGFEIMRREVLNPTDGGAKCPPLEAKMLCNQQPCPVDCKYTDWSGWSKCTAECDAGTRDRSRTIIQKAAYGGEPCADERESEECEIQACDKECELSEWSEWGDCSKQCNAGHSSRTKYITVPAKGEGTCPSETSSDRYMSEACNTEACIKASTVLACDTKVDVLILIDGSLSLGNFGWYATRKQAAELVKAIGSGKADNRVHVLLFSGPIGPNAWDKIQKCNGLVETDWADTSMEEECKMTWLTNDWTNDTAATVAAIKAAKWPMGTTQTSVALGLAETFLGSAREDAKHRVVVYTDGVPMYHDRTEAASTSVKKKAELYWVPITSAAPPAEDVNEWASFPPAEHVISGKTWHSIWSTDFTDAMVANICPSVH